MKNGLCTNPAFLTSAPAAGPVRALWPRCTRAANGHAGVGTLPEHAAHPPRSRRPPHSAPPAEAPRPSWPAGNQSAKSRINPRDDKTRPPSPTRPSTPRPYSTYLVTVRVELGGQVKTAAPLVDAGRERRHVALQLAGHGVDLAGVALARPGQLLGGRQQLLRVGVRVLEADNPTVR